MVTSLPGVKHHYVNMCDPSSYGFKIIFNWSKIVLRRGNFQGFDLKLGSEI